MLLNLTIKNFAIIKELNVDFSVGLNLITGETGVGKSIIVNAVKLLIGGKFSKEYFRTGEEKSVVEGTVVDGNDTIIIRRIFSVNSASRRFLNDEPITVEKLKIATRYFMDLHGQHEQQRLLDPTQHIEYLDAWGDYNEELIKLSELFIDLNRYSSKLNSLIRNEKKTLEKEELYQFQLREINLSDMSVEEESNLQDSFRVLQNASTLKESISNIIDILEDGNLPVSTNLVQIEKLLNNAMKLDPSLGQFYDRIDQLIIELRDITDDLNRYTNTIISDEQLINEMSQKISHVEMLKRKYGGSFSKVVERKNFLEKWMEEKNSFSSQIKLLEDKLENTRRKFMETASIISKKRQAVAIKFEKRITDLLNLLDMKNTIFKIQFSPMKDNQFDQRGIDTCHFQISTNIGEKIKPLNKIVSGGEISRIMLAIKIALQGNDKTLSLIFDEVDTGISGRTAEKIGTMLEQLSNHQQIICITHLPQIASKGNYHLKVFKTDSNDETTSDMKLLNPEERVLEIAGIISGKHITDSGKQQALKLLEGTNG